MNSNLAQNVAIIGAGPAGCICAYYASKNNNVTLFDFSTPLRTLLYTGGGRCNLAHAEYDFKELAKHYPRGEKFLYSVFSQFSTADTVDFFNEIGVETYIQEDMRIFPKSNSAKDVREKMLNALKHCGFKKERVLKIKHLPTCHAELDSASNQYTDAGKISKQVRDDNCNLNFQLITDKATYQFDTVIIAVGGHAGFELAKSLAHKIIEPKPALTGLVTKENFRQIQGLSLKNITAEAVFDNKKVASAQGDLLFTHEGISGPLTYKISSICARLDYSKLNPLLIKLNMHCNKETFSLQDMLNSNPKKDIKNLLSDLVPKSMAEYILETNGIELDCKCCNINGKMRDLIFKSLTEFEINVISPAKEGEVVTSGGVYLNEINPKTMESKIVPNLYFCGEVLDIDGFCGGFNLQNCWSTGYIAGSSTLNNAK